MKDLDALLAGGEPGEDVKGSKENNFSELYLSRYTYEKAFRYARLVMEGKFGTMEVGGFLTTPKDAQDRIARDAFLAKNQEVARAFYRLDAESVQKAGKEIEEKGQKVIGWW